VSDRVSKHGEIVEPRILHSAQLHADAVSVRQCASRQSHSLGLDKNAK
jgi:hypothetical protein